MRLGRRMSVFCGGAESPQMRLGRRIVVFGGGAKLHECVLVNGFSVLGGAKLAGASAERLRPGLRGPGGGSGEEGEGGGAAGQDTCRPSREARRDGRWL